MFPWDEDYETWYDNLTTTKLFLKESLIVSILCCGINMTADIMIDVAMSDSKLTEICMERACL